MFRLVLLSFAALGVCATASISAQDVPVYSNEPSGDYLKDWLICGPFPAGVQSPTAGEVVHLTGFETDFLEACGGEAGAAPKAGDAVALEGGQNVWQRIQSKTEKILLDDLLSKLDNVLAYAYCEIEMPESASALCSLGSNDGGRLWINGEQVWDYSSGRQLERDTELVPVFLKKGRNRILFKIEERGLAWGLVVRFLPLSGESLRSDFRLFDVVLQGDGEPVLQFRHGETVSKRLVEKARVTVVWREEPDQTVWEGNWSGRLRMPLPIDSSEFGEYTLRVAATLSGGLEHTIELPFVAGKPVDHVLFQDGASAYTIILPADASPSEQWAAEELQHALKACGGVDIAIGNDSQPLPGACILVGFGDGLATLLGRKAKRPEALDESFVYRSLGPHIAIWGGNARGTMYGVMSFLERELGVRWYTPKVTVMPKKSRFAFCTLNHTEKPGIRVRNDFYFEAFDPIWAAHNRVNGAMSYREQPGGVEGYWAVHTFFPLVPPSEFFQTHPEYYSLIDGQRIAEYAQLCLTNPEVLRILTERLLDTMRKSPEYLIYCVSQNDWGNPCQCENCQAIATREESEAGPVVWFVNQVAEAVEKEFPDKFVGTLAYQYTRKPPKTIRPRDNVVIRLCSIECCFAHDFNSCPQNASFVSDLRGWAAIAKHMYIWDYVVNFSHYIMPYPNFRVLQSNIKSFRDNNAIGIMEQAAYQSRGGEFAELRAYLLSKLLWDPECDVETVINDFVYGYYGRAGQYVRQYFDVLHGRLTPDTHIHLGLRPDDRLFSDDFVREAEAIFDEAETVADTEEIRQRVEVARLPIMYLKCKRLPTEARTDGTYARFCQIVEREGITHYAEAGTAHRDAFHHEVENAR